MAAFFLKKKKEVTETVEEPQKTVEAAKKEAETVNTEPPATIVCPACGREINKKTAEKNKYVCYECGNYFRVRTKNRIRMVADKDTFEPWFEELESKNPLDFPGYPEKIKAAQEKTGLHEAVTVGKCRIYGLETVIGVCDARFMMSSMGHVVGEKIALAVERATELSLPVILFCCSGGARMQEGIVSLMQMAKTAAALKKHSEAGLLYVPVLTDPTTGGVTASFAMLGDIILAEPGALIGFAGPRVIEQTIGEKLPEGFQRAQFQLEHGFVDAIVERKDLKMTLYRILKMHQKTEGYANFDPLRSDDCYEPPEVMKERATKAQPLSAWEKVRAARRADRLASVDYIDNIFDDFMEFHGDRQFADDPAIVGGVAYLDGQPVTVIGIHKGKDLKDCMRHNYGMPSPEGYRKALRLMKQAEKFHRPIITFIDTPGAYPGKDAEERGQGEAIARNLMEMSGLTVPVLAIVTGEGSSGGALGLGVANHILMLENAVYSVLSPEGFASILWKDASRSGEACTMMKLTAQDLYADGIVEEIIPEPLGGAQRGRQLLFSRLDTAIAVHLAALCKMSGKALADQRYKKYRRIGEMRGA